MSLIERQYQRHETIILGAGISGLTCGLYLQERMSDFLILEQDQRVGGKIFSIREDDLLLENGPNALLIKRSSKVVKEVLAKLAISERLVYPPKEAKARFICKKDQLIKVGPKILFSDMMDWRGRFKFALGGYSKRSLKHEAEESVFDFFSRKIGTRATENLITPLISGIFAGNPHSLLIKTAFPKLYRGDRRSRVLLVGMLKERDANKKLAQTNQSTGTLDYKIKSGVCTLIGGLRDLPQSLGEKLSKHIRCNQEVWKIYRTENGQEWIVESKTHLFQCKNLVVTIPSYDLATILQQSLPAFTSKEGQFFQGLEEKLNGIRYPWLSLVHFTYKKQDIKSSGRGFGFLNTHENRDRFTLGAMFPTYMFPGRVRKQEELFTTFVGGDLYPERAELAPEKIMESAHQEIKKILNIDASAPARSFIYTWPKSIPQYDIYHYDFKKWCEEHSNSFSSMRWHWCSNYWNGISITDCMENAKNVAMSISKE
ncbi:MAG: protoporphyrinogen oxidase [Oligoflexia bacterium]|nr:protoporphyrinogen oxidase [Oligoflexia bacterium]MBF0366557.1 protoporphyrinogen oxidase [Oligoflexia bacterium]